MNASRWAWLAAEYHLPTTYSLRIPMSSTNAAPSLPAPGPGTVRLALIRVGIELLGLDVTRDTLFPAICAAEVRVRPPAQIAVTSQKIRMYKAGNNGKFQESIGYREVCQAQGPLTIFVRTPDELIGIFTQILSNIGYWGQANGLAFCTTVSRREPVDGECAMPLADLPPGRAVQPYFASLVTDLRDVRVKWIEVMPRINSGVRRSPLRYDIYLWPLEIIEQHSTHRFLQYRSLNRGDYLQD